MLPHLGCSAVTWRMDLQTLAALDRAFQKLGFIHKDMRVSNVMEHHLDAEPLYPKGFGQRQKKHAVGVLTGPKKNTFSIPGELLLLIESLITQQCLQIPLCWYSPVTRPVSLKAEGL